MALAQGAGRGRSFRHPAHDRDRAAAVPENLAPPLRQARLRLGRADARAAGRALRPADRGRRLRARDAGRISELHRAAVRALRGRRRHPGDRQPARHAARQRRDPRLRHADREPRRHHRRGHDPDPPAHPRQRRRGCTTCTSWCSSSFLVANIGGALSPLGDPPLFVGFLRGVDFFWTAQHLWLQTALVAGSCLRPSSRSTSGSTARTAWSRRSARRPPPVDLGVRGSDQPRADRRHHRRDPRLGDVEAGHRLRRLRHHARTAEPPARRGAGPRALLSLWLTPDEHREANGFTWEPIAEVAILFAGIFVCIIPVLAMLAGRQGRRLRLAACRRHRARRHAARRRLFLAHRRALGLPRQRADLSGVLRARRRRRAAS